MRGFFCPYVVCCCWLAFSPQPRRRAAAFYDLEVLNIRLTTGEWMSFSKVAVSIVLLRLSAKFLLEGPIKKCGFWKALHHECTGVRQQLHLFSLVKLLLWLNEF